MSIALTIRVTGNPVEYEYDIQVYTHVQRDYIYYRQEVKSNEIQLAYLETLPILSHEAIELNSYLENIIPPIDTTVYSTKENVVYSEKSNLIFTTVTAPESYGKKPLFFCHKIKGKVSNVSFIPWKNGIDSSNWIYLEKYNAIFSDLMNDLDVEIGRYNANFVQYTTVSSSIYAQSGQSIKEIYKREPLFSEQTVFDYDEETLEINQNAPVYYKTQEPDGKWKYEFVKPVNETLYYTEYRQAKLSARMNNGLPLNYSWPIEIIGSSLTVKPGQGPSITYNWTNPDADRWFPYYPYLTLKKQGYYVNRNSFQVLNSHIVVNPSENIHLTFKVYRYSDTTKDYKLLFAQSSDLVYVGKKISGNYIDNNIIKYTKFTGSVDYSLGIVTISDQVPLNPRDKIIAEYVVKEEESEYNFYNVNPLHNKKVLDGYLFFFATPKTEAENSKIYWAWMKDRYNSQISAYSEYVYDTNYPNKSLILGMFISEFKDMCTYNFVDSYVPDSFTADMQFLPICSASFKKKKYTESSSVKDLRVLSALKEDYEIEKKNKNAVFSNILNASGFINVDSSSQVFVYIDKDESFYSDSFDDMNFKDIINRNLPVTLVGHQKNISYVDINYLHIKGRTEAGEQILTINMEVAHKGNRLAIYVVNDPNGVSSKDTLLTTLDVEDYSGSDPLEVDFQGFDRDITTRYTKEVNLVPESADDSTLNDTVKDFVYLAFESYNYDLGTGTEALIGPRSQVSCYYIDRSL
jgi:hypothetical protein